MGWLPANNVVAMRFAIARLFPLLEKHGWRPHSANPNSVHLYALLLEFAPGIEANVEKGVRKALALHALVYPPSLVVMAPAARALSVQIGRDYRNHLLTGEIAKRRKAAIADHLDSEQMRSDSFGLCSLQLGMFDHWPNEETPPGLEERSFLLDTINAYAEVNPGEVPAWPYAKSPLSPPGRRIYLLCTAAGNARPWNPSYSSQPLWLMRLLCPTASTRPFVPTSSIAYGWDPLTEPTEIRDLVG